MSNELKNFNHIDLLFPSKYAKAADLRGKNVPVVIERIVPREKLMMQGGKSDQKPVVYLRGKEKGWILNKTNARAIAKVYGPEITAWLGKTVVIMSAEVEARGEMVEAIRVNVEATRKAANGSARAEAPPDAADQQLADDLRATENEPGAEG
jgi:glutamine synthetase type III